MIHLLVLACLRKIALAGLAWGIVIAPASADPESDRLAILALYKQKFPDIPLDAYVDGALMLSPDAKSQFDSIMEFPPFQGDIDKGRQLWEKPFANAHRFADCFPNGGHNIAGDYPQYDAAADKVVTFEMALNRCLTRNDESEFKYSDKLTMGILTAYARSLSDGMRLNVRVETPGARAKYEEGKRRYYQRVGQYNFACASCHMENAGRILRTEILSPVAGQATHWPVFRGGDNLNTLQMRFRRCLEQMRAAPLAPGSEELNNLEYFHSYVSNGLPMRASVYRK